MGWSWRIARIAGIDVYMHFTFLLLLAWVGASHYLARGNAGDGGMAMRMASGRPRAWAASVFIASW